MLGFSFFLFRAENAKGTHQLTIIGEGENSNNMIIIIQERRRIKKVVGGVLLASTAQHSSASSLIARFGWRKPLVLLSLHLCYSCREPPLLATIAVNTVRIGGTTVVQWLKNETWGAVMCHHLPLPAGASIPGGRRILIYSCSHIFLT
jgi:hypothetical protein